MRYPSAGRFVDRTFYLKTQPPDTRKKGFYSSDASRRDEFSMDIEVRMLPRWQWCCCHGVIQRDDHGHFSMVLMLFLSAAFASQTSKWRERIGKEANFAAHFAKRQEESLTEEEKARMAEIEASGKEKRWTHGPEYLFDLGKEATGGVTPYEMKDARETWYSKHRVAKLNDGIPYTGGVKLSSHAVGDNLKGYSEWAKPEFARQPIIRDSFYRSTGVLRGE